MFFEEASVVFTEMLHVCLDEPSPLPLLPPPPALSKSLYYCMRNSLEMKSLFTFSKKAKENRSICLQSTVAQETPRVAHQAAVTHLLGV